MRPLVIITLIALCGLGIWLAVNAKAPKPDKAAPRISSGSGTSGSEAPPRKNAASPKGKTPDRAKANPPAAVKSPVHFTTVNADGLDFVHESGISEDRHYPCANGSGLAAIDLDRDGLSDLYFATGNFFSPSADLEGRSNRCYRNLGDWQFQDVTEHAGLTLVAYSAGVAVGDFNADGFSDLYVTCCGENQLYQNQGDGTFHRLTNSGTNHAGFAASAVFFDQDNDGLPELYVCNYGEWSVETNRQCDDGTGRNLRLFCAPKDIPPAADVLYHNAGDGTFRDRSEQLGGVLARGQGVIAIDVNNDDFIDLYVGNDANANRLYLTESTGELTDATETAGVAYDSGGRKQAGMGVAAADVNRDGSLDLIVTNYENEYNTLYLGQDNRLFEDLTQASGIGVGAMPWVGWGVSMKDLDLDRWPDLLVVNGHVEPRLFEIGAGTEYEQPPVLWRNNASRFEMVTTGAGEYFESRHPARGLVVADLDNDGDYDVIVGHQDQKPALLRNDLVREPPASIEVRFVGLQVNRDGIGCKASIPGAPPLTYQVQGGGSYLSTDANRILIAAVSPTAIEVVWPGGRRSSTAPLEPGKRYIVREPDRGRSAQVFELP